MKKDYFNSIDTLPIWNWWKIAETGNLIYLHVDGKYEEKDYSLVDLWDEIQNEYLDTFGITDEFRKMLHLKKKWISKKANFILTGDRFNLTEIDIIEADMSDTMETKIKVNKDDTLIMLEQKLNRGLDPKKVSVKKYYNYINYFSKNG